MNPRSIGAVALLLSLSIACKVSLSAPPSTAAGLGEQAGQGPHELKPKTEAELDGMAERLGSLMAQATKPRPYQQITRSGLQTSLSQAYQDEVAKAGGLARADGERVLRRLLAKRAPGCDLFSHVLGLRPEEVGSFLDAMLLQVMSSRSLLEQAERRALLLASLANAEPKPLAALFAEMARNRPLVPVKVAPDPSEIPRAEEIRNRSGEDFVRAVSSFTIGDYPNVRQATAFTDGELKAQGWDGTKIAHWRAKAEIIEAGIAKLPVFKPKVFRGVRKVDPNALVQLLEAQRKGRPIGLGIDHRRGLTSASWDADYAYKQFSGLGAFFPAPESYGLLYEISDHRGVSIEAISSFTGEREILLPGDGTYLVESLGVVAGDRPVIHAKLRGVRRPPAD